MPFLTTADKARDYNDYYSGFNLLSNGFRYYTSSYIRDENQFGALKSSVLDYLPDEDTYREVVFTEDMKFITNQNSDTLYFITGNEQGDKVLVSGLIQEKNN